MVGAEISGGTLLWGNRRILSKPIIVLAQQAQTYSRLIEYTLIYSANIVPAQEQHKYVCLR